MDQFLSTTVEGRLMAINEYVYYLWQIYFLQPVYSGPSPTVSEDVE
jgi:hypothetical protein